MKDLYCQFERKNDSTKQCNSKLGQIGQFTIANFYCRDCKNTTEIIAMEVETEHDIENYVMALSKKRLDKMQKLKHNKQ